MNVLMKAAGLAGAVTILIAVALAPLAAANPGASGSDVNRELAAARQATAKYHDVNEALAAGYVPVSPHIPGMGAHYVNFGLVDATFDVTMPELLIYSLASGGKPKLVAVEYGTVVPTPGFTGDSDVWETHLASCHYADGYEVPMPDPAGCPPTSPGGAPLALWHPDIHALHVWLWRGNPNGVFAPFNPSVP